MWRHIVSQKFCGDACGHTVLLQAQAQLGFHIEEEECMKKIVSEHGQQPEEKNGIGGMLVDVVGMPMGDQLVEGIVFDAPTPMRYGNK